MHFLAISPNNTLVLDARVSVMHLKIAQICKNTCIFFHKFRVFPVTERHEILPVHFSSRHQTENSPHNPQKVQNLSISTPECHEFWRPGNYSRPETRESTKPAQKHTNFNLNALIDPKLYTP